MGRPYHNTHRIRDVLQKLSAAKRFVGRSGSLLVPEVWQACVGEQIAKHSRPLRLSRKTLTLAVESSAWMNELQFYTDEIIARVNETLGDGKVNDIKMRVGRWDHAKNAPRFKPELELVLTHGEQLRLDTILSPVRDPELKERIASAWRKNRLRQRAAQGSE